MKLKRIFILLICNFLFSTLNSSAQQNTVAAGGVATGIGGTVSYSIGQIDYVTASGAGGSASQGVQQVYKLQVNLKYYIQGYYETAGLMKPVLMNQGVGSSLTNVDTVTIELHHATAPYLLAASYTGVLQINGTISCPFPNVNAGSTYYVVLKHRNSIETWSASPVILSDNVYNFSTAANMAFGGNQIAVEPNVFAIYNGDINQDENTDLLDLSVLENDINAFVFGYLGTDINGDGNVDLLDGPIMEANVNDFVFSNHP